MEEEEGEGQRVGGGVGVGGCRIGLTAKRVGIADKGGEASCPFFMPEKWFEKFSKIGFQQFFFENGEEARVARRVDES